MRNQALRETRPLNARCIFELASKWRRQIDRPARIKLSIFFKWDSWYEN
jgi:hypothetical protein